jgi:hypothetical protein
MDSSKMAVLAPMWGLMILWLGLVAASIILAFQKWQKTEDSLKKQMFYLWFGGTLVFIGDSLHTIAFTVSTFTGDPTGPINVFGTTFEFRTFAMFFDALVFMFYYTLWALFIVVRYQQGQFASYDKISFGLAMAAIVLILPGAVPNALGIYTLNYNIAIWAPHMIFFVIFGVMTVFKLIRCSRHTLTHTSDTIIQTQERALSIAGIGFAFSFLFFVLFLALVPLSEKFGMFMILKTFAYMLAFFYLIKGVIIPTPTKA